MITDYMEDLEISNPWSHLKPWQKTPYEKARGKNIHKNQNGKYYIEKAINNKRLRWGTFNTFQEALEVRDELIKNGWVKVPTLKDKTKEYYVNIHKANRHYCITKKDKFHGSCGTIEEALWYRDLCKEHNWEFDKKPFELDLKTDNPYLKDGLEYPVPKRLIIPPKAPKRCGSISSKGPQFYGLTKGSEYYGGYRTYEMAWYVREEMNKCGWDKSKLDEIVENYPVWYTWLVNFYKFVFPKYEGWAVNITPKHSDNGKLQHLYFRKLEDALWERDLLLKYEWDEELLIECADDTLNPYYDMELPPYPQRKIRRIKDYEDRTELFNTLFELLQEDDYSQEAVAELAGTNAMTIRNILVREFDSNWAEFKTICESGENPNDVLEQKKIIYNPDLTVHYENTNYVSYYKNEKSPYVIYHRDKVTQQSIYFGAYPTRELANKISNDLQACNWDKSKLKEIQAKHGWKSKVNSVRWVYPHKYTSKKTGKTKIMHWQVRKKNKDKKHINYGHYKDKRVAELVRDLLIEYDWNKDFLQTIKEYAEYCIYLVDHNWRCKL